MYSARDKATAAVGYLPNRGNKVVLKHISNKYSKRIHTQSRPTMYVFNLNNAELYHISSVTHHILHQPVGNWWGTGGQSLPLCPFKVTPPTDESISDTQCKNRITRSTSTVPYIPHCSLHAISQLGNSACTHSVCDVNQRNKYNRT